MENEKKKELFSSITMNAFADEAIRGFVAANDRLDRISTLMTQISFGVAGLSATRVTTATVDLPYTFLAIILLGLSITLGSIQFITDYFHFFREGEACRNIASKSFSLLLTEKHEIAQDLSQNLVNFEKIAKKSNITPLTLQIVLIIISVVLVLVELRYR